MHSYECTMVIQQDNPASLTPALCPRSYASLETFTGPNPCLLMRKGKTTSYIEDTCARSCRLPKSVQALMAAP